MRIGYFLILVIVLFLIFPYSHSSVNPEGTLYNERFQEIALNSRNRENTQTDYYLTSNFTIPNGSSYSIKNTRFIITGNYSIDDFGTLCILNSTVVGANRSDNLSISVNGSIRYQSRLNISNSAYCIPGSMELQNASGSFVNTLISSGCRNASDPQKALTFSASHSNIFSYNSTFTGLIQTDSSLKYAAGYDSFNRSIPFSSNALIPLNYRNASGYNPLVTGINVSMQYSGNNPSGKNSVDFSYFGMNYTYYFESTGSVFTYDQVCFTIPVKEPFCSTVNYSKNLKAEMNIYSETGSNTTIKTLCIKYDSNDTVSYYGSNFFSYSIKHSDAVFVNSTLEFNRNDQYSYLNLRNPLHDYLNALNSSVYIADSRSYSSSGDSSFYVKSNSTIFCLYYVGLTFADQGSKVTNFTVTITDQDNNSSIDYQNSFVASIITSNHIPTEYVNDYFYETYLLSDLISCGNIVYTNEYQVSLYGKNYTLSLPPYNFSAGNGIIENFQIDLPIISINPVTTGILIGENNRIKFQFKDYSLFPLDFNYSMSYYNSTNLIAETTNQSCMLSPGEVLQRSFNMTFPDFVANKTKLIITVYSEHPTISGQNFTETYSLNAFVNASMSIRSSYAWIHDDSKMTLVINITGYSGSENSILKITVSSCPVHGLAFNRTFNTSAYHFSIKFTCNLSFSEVPDNITITASLSSDILVFINGNSTDILSISGNASYFPQSMIIFSEIGLPSGISWGIEINGSCYDTYQESQSIQVENGEYNFTVLGVPNYVSNISSGIIYAVHEKEYVNLSFTQHLYSVNIEEIGLPDNYSWTVSYDSENFTAHGNCIIICVPNGTYLLHADTLHFVSSNISFPVIVNGHSVTLQIRFSPVKTRSLIYLIAQGIIGSPLTYIIAIISVLLYIRIYKGSVLLCSKCLQPIGHFKRKCSCEISNPYINER